MNVELVAQMFKNYQSNVLFHLEGKLSLLCLSWMHPGVIVVSLRDSVVC